jgi:hypothetical protein
MKETSILMIEEMASKTLDDIKTMTRRVIGDVWQLLRPDNGPHLWAYGFKYDEGSTTHGNPYKLACPYGGPGDRLWVKETHYRYGHWIKNGLTETGRQRFKFYALTDEVRFFDNKPDKLAKVNQTGWHKRPSIFLPKRFARLWLEIVSIRAERLQDITEKDIAAEGRHFNQRNSPLYWMEQLWDSINAERQGGAYAWDKNPPVWVIEFRRLEK